MLGYSYVLEGFKDLKRNEFEVNKPSLIRLSTHLKGKGECELLQYY